MSQQVREPDALHEVLASCPQCQNAWASRAGQYVDIQDLRTFSSSCELWSKLLKRYKIRHIHIPRHIRYTMYHILYTIYHTPHTTYHMPHTTCRATRLYTNTNADTHTYTRTCTYLYIYIYTNAYTYTVIESYTCIRSLVALSQASHVTLYSPPSSTLKHGPCVLRRSLRMQQPWLPGWTDKTNEATF